MKRARFVARGRVQGVFFRDSVRGEAERLGVAGWASNRSDGGVEGAFEGEGADVDSMVEFVRAGPGEASVESLELTEERPEGANGFEIRRG